MGIIQSKETTVHYDVTLDQVKALISSDLGVSPESVSINYVIGDIGPDDPMNRFPAPRGVVKLSVTVNV